MLTNVQSTYKLLYVLHRLGVYPERYMLYVAPYAAPVDDFIARMKR